MVAYILVIDDDPSCRFLQSALRGPETVVDTFMDPTAAPTESLHRYDLLIADIRMTRLASFRKIREILPQTPVVLLSTAGDLETTMEAVKWGAWDCLKKPFPPGAIHALAAKILTVRDMCRQNTESAPSTSAPARFIGSSDTMMAFYKQIARVADADASVLIEGESGTGKDLTAHALHHLSSRRGKPFLVVHCGAIPETLLESELFGYEKGAFTGADRAHPGLLETAEDGSLFLDEITEMAPSLQGKLLRFMQNGEVRRLGGYQVRQVTVRVIASTNRNLDEEIKAKRFRADLMYRFVVRLVTPPLREHKDDLPQLIRSILQKNHRDGVYVSPEAMEMLCAYDWPGNVRELENILRQTQLLCPYPVILPEHLPERLHNRPGTEPLSLTLLEEAERTQILKTMQTHGWNQSKAAQILGIDRKTLRTKMLRYWLDKDY
ncbi:MAG TPA: sigma-54 dependent transcriptional regulator [Syntrophales bacterium]|mgnify:CR=1 FL=1|nr:sigma-54 dependent transcriptional regulator [Syntrophales bacterium]HPX55005.1 sigma-54 dependent transcriptional regulator [Syntrophales bacterium]HQA82706.1 sigma-54 dependent transcriptional regulator [Syntrophales bacterium]